MQAVFALHPLAVFAGRNYVVAVHSRIDNFRKTGWLQRRYRRSKTPISTQ